MAPPIHPIHCTLCSLYTLAVQMLHPPPLPPPYITLCISYTHPTPPYALIAITADLPFVPPHCPCPMPPLGSPPGVARAHWRGTYWGNWWGGYWGWGLCTGRGLLGSRVERPPTKDHPYARIPRGEGVGGSGTRGAPNYLIGAGGCLLHLTTPLGAKANEHGATLASTSAGGQGLVPPMHQCNY